MKLLDKTTIIAQKGNERKKEIEEGAKLAKKIDALREVAAKEEVNIGKFRVQSLKKVKEDIDSLLTTKSELESEVTSLKSERDRLMVPLDREWNEVNRKMVDLVAERFEIEQKEILLSSLQESIDHQEKNLEVEKQRIADIKKQVIENGQEIKKYNEEARNLLLDTEHKSTIILDALQTRQNELQQKENELKYREIDLNNKHQELTNKAIELNSREKSINDKYQTLLRTQEHVKRKH